MPGERDELRHLAGDVGGRLVALGDEADGEGIVASVGARTVAPI